ncbi:MAG: phosphoribosylanthranilate isomerase [Caldilineales bacterium]|nr:phosphoribosylanthranilate isomerase [Caldilineales bacterium]
MPPSVLCSLLSDLRPPGHDPRQNLRPHHLADAQAALDAGADLLGFICYPQLPRYLPAPLSAPSSPISNPQSQSPISPTYRTNGVFVDEPLETIQRLLTETGLDLAQLHGSEPPVVLERLGGRAFKALRSRSLVEAEADAEWYADLGPADGPDLLLDGYHPQLRGGAGQRADWDIAAALARQHRLLLAGGLTPANVAEAVARVQPWGVDVSSGVETEPGRKDHEAVRAFVLAAKSRET